MTWATTCSSGTARPRRPPDWCNAGAVAVATPAEAAAVADFLITMVSDPSALRAVSEGDDGIAAGAGASLAVIEMSTVGPPAIVRLAKALPREAELIDAPVLGSIGEAESGALTIFAGGPPPLVERARPLLAALGSVVHAGPLGAGAAAKLVANATLFTTLAALGEAIALARGLGPRRASSTRSWRRRRSRAKPSAVDRRSRPATTRRASRCRSPARTPS